MLKNVKLARVNFPDSCKFIFPLEEVQVAVERNKGKALKGSLIKVKASEICTNPYLQSIAIHGSNVVDNHPITTYNLRLEDNFLVGDIEMVLDESVMRGIFLAKPPLYQFKPFAVNKFATVGSMNIVTELMFKEVNLLACQY